MGANIEDDSLWYNSKQMRDKDYKLQQHEIDSIKEIRKMLAQNAYKDKKTAYEHLEYLEKLGDKLKQSIAVEETEGEVAWVLRNDFIKIKQTFDELQSFVNKIWFS